MQGLQLVDAKLLHWMQDSQLVDAKFNFQLGANFSLDARFPTGGCKTSSLDAKFSTGGCKFSQLVDQTSELDQEEKNIFVGLKQGSNASSCMDELQAILLKLLLCRNELQISSDQNATSI